MKRGPRLRGTPADQIHLTVLFLGSVPRSEMPRITESIERSCSGISPFNLTPERVAALPPKGRPRVLALETDAPAPILELRARLVRRLARSSRPNPNDRFLPHFTLARFAESTSARSALEAVQAGLEAESPPASFRIDSLRLMRSVLTLEGAVHSQEAEFDLLDEV